MTVDVKVPVFPESVSDGTLVAWHKNKGDAVAKDEVIADVETDKVVFEIPSPDDGVIADTVVPEGATVTSAQLLAKIDNSAQAKQMAQKHAAATSVARETSPPPLTPSLEEKQRVMPAAKRMIEEKGIKAADVTGTGKGGRILKEDVMRQPSASPSKPGEPVVVVAGERLEKRVPMTRLRARIAERLVEAQHTAAILTTFNEINMKPVMDMRERYKDVFEKKHGIKLGFMSFFVKASVEALKRFPEINASIDGHDIVYHGYYDIGIAIGSPRGLVVPILRNADQLSFAQIESQIKNFGERAKTGKLAIEELSGGTFSITNGGIFGSMMSTPILNPPQSGILGMHKTTDRPVAEHGQVVIRPMMYVALSYDHRIVDGKEAVQFLVAIKELIEDPARFLLEV